ncbi:mycofactocin dehydrogenase MftG [Rhodococcus phenolicus]|uniref:mycofactocin dehydrogenase MftG n=1 Tax=Rhodococcus phenolicus TaxID=263849 RepID=UPI0009EEDFDA|nr:mycofactocin system GMC family oxidoreductase MftG [Rhodococcus phenolicus]
MLPAHADVVVVGGGSCGSVVAARISDDPDRSVLLLEEGPGYRSVADTPREILDAATIPVGPGSRWAATFPARPTPETGTTVSRGRLLGGSGAVNGAYFVRARPGDLAHWPASWSYDEVLADFRAVETDTDFPGDLHGSDGPVPVARVPWDRLHPVSAAFHRTAVSAGFATVDDLNAPGPDGVGRVPLNIRDGMRVGPALAYLLPVLHRPNLTVTTGTEVLRVVVANGRAVAVKVAEGTGARTITADHVVVCAGAVRSPQLLMLSGIGPADELRRIGITLQHNLSGVGRDFTDHPEVAIGYRYRRDVPTGSPLLETVLHTGTLELRPYTVPFGAAIPGSGVADPVFGVVLTRPRSRGRIVLDRADPRSAPVLDYRYLGHPQDRADLREGVRLASNMLAAMTDLVDASGLTTTLGTSLHLSGTCRMGDDEGAVVDERCRVRGIDGLSVVDTSVFPEVPSRGPHATAVMLAHRFGVSLWRSEAPRRHTRRFTPPV